MWISLVGFMGAGKNRVAAELGDRALLPVVDLDARVVELAGTPVSEIFASRGEPVFRRLETAALYALDRRREQVVACGGGVVERPANVARLREAGVVIWLDAAWNEVRRRLEADPADRPLLRRLGWDGMERLFHRRRPAYARAAHFRLRSDLETPALLAVQSLRCRLALARERAEAKA